MRLATSWRRSSLWPGASGTTPSTSWPRAAGSGNRATTGADGRGEQLDAQMVTARFFDVLGVKPIVGRTFISEDDRADSNVVVISEGFWRTRLGSDPNVLGRPITLDGQPLLGRRRHARRFSGSRQNRCLDGPEHLLYAQLRRSCALPACRRAPRTRNDPRTGASRHGWHCGCHRAGAAGDEPRSRHHDRTVAGGPRWSRAATDVIPSARRRWVRAAHVLRKRRESAACEDGGDGDANWRCARRWARGGVELFDSC